MNRVYLSEDCKVSHIAKSCNSVALCGRSPWPRRWLGVDPSERAAAAMLVVCYDCAMKMRRSKQ